MKLSLVFFLVVLSLHLSFSSVEAQWVPLNGPTGGDITSFVSVGTNIFAATRTNGVLRTTNNGTSWGAVNIGLTDTGISALAVLGTNLFAGTYYSGVFRSTDNGSHWLATKLVHTYVTAFAVIGPNIYAATADTVFLSTDNGVSWSPANTGLPGNTYVTHFAVIGSNLFAATAGGVFISTNNGSSWALTGLLASTRSLVVNGSNLFAATSYDGVYRSTDSGVNWSPINVGLPTDTAVSAFALIGANLFAGTYGGGLYMTSNNGTSWLPAGLSNTSILALLASGTNLFASTGNTGIFLSSNMGSSWKAVNVGLPNTDVIALAVIDTNIFAATGGGLFLSTDSGASWTSSFIPLAINALATIRSDLFAGVTGGVYISTNLGLGWDEYGGTLSDLNVQALAVSGTYLIAGTDTGGIFFSPDFATTWYGSGSLIDTSITALAVIGTNLFAGIQGRGVLLSTDTGATWRAINTGLTDLFAGTENGGVFLSTNFGSNWNAVNVGLSDTDVKALAVSGSNLLAGTYGAGVWRRPLSEMIKESIAADRLTTKPEISSYPNPFSKSTKIAFTSKTGYATVSIVNLLGQEVVRLFSGELAAGEHAFTWEAHDVPQGIYECVIQTGGHIERAPMIVVR